MVRSSEDTPPCPVCRGELAYRDSRHRIRRREGGIKDILQIRRFQCKDCRRLHNELPDCLCPYKHYETEVICGVVEGTIELDAPTTEDYPSESTMKRWITWYRMNLTRAEGYLRNAILSVPQIAKRFSGTHRTFLEELQETLLNWLETVIRIIYNSGGSLATIDFYL